MVILAELDAIICVRTLPRCVAVAQRTLDPLALVRIQAGQPFDSLRRLMAVAYLLGLLKNLSDWHVIPLGQSTPGLRLLLPLEAFGPRR